jgi:hypothetical protein
MTNTLLTIAGSEKLDYSFDRKIEVVPVGKLRTKIKAAIYTNLKPFFKQDNCFFEGLKKFGIREANSSGTNDEIITAFFNGIRSVVKFEIAVKRLESNGDYLIFFFVNTSQLLNLVLEFNFENNGYYLYNAYERYLSKYPELLTTNTTVDEFYVNENDIPFLKSDNSVETSVINDYDDIDFEPRLPVDYEVPTILNLGRTYPTSTRDYLEEVSASDNILLHHNKVNGRIYLTYTDVAEEELRNIIFTCLSNYINDIKGVDKHNFTFYRLTHNEIKFLSSNYVMYILSFTLYDGDKPILMKYGITHDVANKAIYLSEYNFTSLNTEEFTMKDNHNMKNGIIANPYDTTYGKMFNITNTEKALLKYYTGTSDKNLNYEYGHDIPVGLLVITGYCEDEKNLPVFEHPIIFKDIRNNLIVAVDMRKYVRQTTEQPMSLREIAKDTASLDCIMLRAMLTAQFLNGDTGIMRNLDKNFASGYTLLLSWLLNIMGNFNPIDKVSIEIVIAHYYYSMMIEEHDLPDMQVNLHARIAKTPLSLPITIKNVENTLRNIRPEVRTIDGLIENIKLVISDDKRMFINTDALVNLLSSMWYGPGGAEAMIMSLEHLPTWMALMYSATVDKTYKRSRLASTLDKYGAKVKPSEIEKGVELYFKEHTM